MSAGVRIPLERAQLVAFEFLAYLSGQPATCPLDMPGAEAHAVKHGPVEAIVAVGSVRRGRPEVGDVEFVLQPRIEHRPGPGQATLFGPPPTVPVNLAWEAVDRLVAEGLVDIEPSHKSGTKARQVGVSGVTVDLYSADAVNFGHIALIRTGGATFSRLYMSAIKRRGYQSVDGYIEAATSEAKTRHPDLVDGRRVPVPNEAAVFNRILGIPWIPPPLRSERAGDTDATAFRRWFGGVR